MPLAVRPQEQRAERRRKRQRVDRRDDRRGGDRQRELAIELAGYAGDEGGREYSAADLVHGLVGGVARRHALRDVALDILDDDDRVVDHDADRQHEAEQGQRIEREAERAHHRESAYERHRDRDDRDDRRAPRLQEHDDDDDDEDQRLEQRLVDLAHGLGDELGRVVDDLVVDAGGEIALELVHLLDDALRGGERIAARALEDGERHGWLAVQVRVRDVVAGAELDTRHIADAHEAPAIGGLDDHLPELAHILETPLRLHGELEGGIRRRGLLAERTARDLDVLLLQGTNDIGCGELIGGEPVRIEPDPDRVFAGAEELD